MNEQLIGIITNILVIIVIILGILWKAVKDKKSNGKVDLEMIPGHSQECQERGETLVRLETNYENLITTVARTDKIVSSIWKHVKKNGTT